VALAPRDTDVWLLYVECLRAHARYALCRDVFKRALAAAGDPNVHTLSRHWLLFERLLGDHDTLQEGMCAECACVCVFTRCAQRRR
jgi:hypothetical protein